MRFLLAYDVSDPARLRKCVAVLETAAVRMQKSVFLSELSPAELDALLDEAAAHLDPSADLLQAWRLAPGETPTGRSRGEPAEIRPAAVVASAGGRIVVRPPPDPSAAGPRAGRSGADGTA